MSIDWDSPELVDRTHEGGWVDGRNGNAAVSDFGCRLDARVGILKNTSVQLS